MESWEIVDALSSSNDQHDILSKIPPDHPFWCGISYAIDPLVGVIVRLPLRDPPVFGHGFDPVIFDNIARLILNGELKGDQLVLVLEKLSRSCRPYEWTRWYRPILEGRLNPGVSLDLFNEYCPDNHRVSPPALNKPKPIDSLADLPERFIIQPLYPYERVFWMVDSKVNTPEILGYDQQVRRLQNPAVVHLLASYAKTVNADIMLTGFQNQGDFFAEDILTRDQFTRQSGAYPLAHRLAAMLKLKLPMVQVSDQLTPKDIDGVHRELNMLFEQRFDGAIVRDLDSHFPFQVQTDLIIHPKIKAIMTCDGITDGESIHGVQNRANKTVEATIRLGLTKSIWRDISSTSNLGRKFDILSCGVRDGEHLFPLFKRWRD